MQGFGVLRIESPPTAPSTPFTPRIPPPMPPAQATFLPPRVAPRPSTHSPDLRAPPRLEAPHPSPDAAASLLALRGLSAPPFSKAEQATQPPESPSLGPVQPGWEGFDHVAFKCFLFHFILLFREDKNWCSNPELSCRAARAVPSPPSFPSVLWLQTDSHWTPGPRQSPQTPRAPRPSTSPPFWPFGSCQALCTLDFPGTSPPYAPPGNAPPFPFPLWKTSPQTAPRALPAACCIAVQPQ